MGGEIPLVMDTCQGPCGLTVPEHKLHKCSCPCKKMMTIDCLRRHSKDLHLNVYHIKAIGGRK